MIKAEAPEIEGPKVVKKIDLSTIDSSTRPKKSVKAKKEETPIEKEIKSKEENKPTKGKGRKKKEEEVKPVEKEVIAKTEPG